MIEPSYPYAALADIGPEKPSRFEGWKIRNSWYSAHKRSDIVIAERPDGSITWLWKPAFHHIAHDLETLGCSQVWGLEQEQAALQLLAGMVRHHQMRQYVLTGMFLERSVKSGVTYLFRRLKPTIAMAAHPGFSSDDPKWSEMRCLAALCMHPIAYYEGSWAGAMCPTDDVIAHLVCMRGDERLFWKRCNQHPAYRPEAGL